jgi:hypothetical protein
VLDARASTHAVPDQTEPLTSVMVGAELAARLMRVALGHLTREYPYKLDQVLTGPADLVTPQALHPIFFGSFDWHSCVHAYWLLARLSRHQPDLPESDRVGALFAGMFTKDNVSGELAYLSRPFTRTFERPYGWAWLLMLAAESRKHEDESWSVTLRPLAKAFARRFIEFLPKATYPARSGVHSNTAFALALAMEYARTCRDQELARMISSTARAWYFDDADCQAWEPGGEDFLSPALMEAECMRRVLPAGEFSMWLSRFLPRIDQLEPRTLFQPAAVSDRTDGRIAHLDGLNLSRAWCWSNLATSLPKTDPRHDLMRGAAEQHREASLGHIADDYMGEHWLATFALLALEVAA